jgi:hypothetical protein
MNRQKKPSGGSKSQRKQQATESSARPQPQGCSFSCLVLDKFAAAADSLPETPKEGNNRGHPEIMLATTAQTDDSSSINLQGSLSPSTTESIDVNVNSGRKEQHKDLRQQKITNGISTRSPWEISTQSLKQEAMRALQCRPRDDDMNGTVADGENNTSTRAVFPDDLSDYELGTYMHDGIASTVEAKTTRQGVNKPPKPHVSSSDLKELVKAASTAVDSLEQKLNRCRTLSVCLLVLLIVVILVAVALGIGLVGRGIASSSEGSLTGPTSAPTMSEGFSLDVLHNYLEDYTLVALSDPTSPQSLAWEWLERQVEQGLYADSGVSADALVTRFVLAVLYYSTAGNTWTSNTAWLSTQHVCEWYNDAVEACNNETFAQLSLPKNNMTGSIPREIKMLKDLERLDLSFNQVTELPESLNSLSNLKKLELQQLALTDIPDLPSTIQHLNLRDNTLTKIPLEISNMTGLQTLLLGGNSFQFEGIPDFLSSLTNLTYLSLENSQIGESLPKGLGRLTRLEYLILEENSLMGGIPSELSTLTGLKLMSLHQNMLSGSVPTEVCALKAQINMFISVDCDTIQCDCGCGCGL